MIPPEAEDTRDPEVPTAADFEALVTPCLSEMLSAARAILGSDDLAWDAVQETLLRVWTRGWLPEDPSAILVYLTVKSGLHQLRCGRRRAHHESREERLGAPCCEDDPLVAAENAEGAALVREAVRSLTDEYRVVMEAFAFEGESYEAIASRFDLPIGTVRSRLSRGRALLRQRLDGHFDAA